MADNSSMADNTNNTVNNDNSILTDNNAIFGEFFELDLLDPSAGNPDLFSFFNEEDLNAMANSPSTLTAEALLDLTTLDSFNNIESIPLLDQSSNQEIVPTTDSAKTENDLRILLAHNLQQQQELQTQAQAQTLSTANAVVDSTALIAHLTTPTEPLPQNLATPVASPATPTIKAPESTISTAAANAQIAILLDSSKSAMASSAITASTSATSAKETTKAPSPAPASPKKRSSSEPITTSRKKAKSDTPPVLTPITAKSPATVPDMTSTVNTTLSAATLQFLLQQQMQTPLVPQLFTGKLTREEIEDTLARLLESTKHLIEASKGTKENEEGAESEEDSESAESSEPGQTHGLKTQPGIKTDDIPSSKDLKKMTSKERRQLRNKISARNFRVRRKEYISTLEGQVEQHKTEARHLREAVVVIQAENQRLKEELEESKRQLAQANAARTVSTANPQQLQLSQPISLSNESQSLLASLLTRTVINPNAKNITLTAPRPQSSIIKPNLNKDVPNSASVTGKSWKDESPIFIHTTLIPEIHLADNLQFGPKPSASKQDNILDLPWMCMETPSKKPSTLEKNPLLMSGVIYELMQTIASVGLSHPELSLVKQESVFTALHDEDDKAMVQDYESDRRLGEALEWKMQLELIKETEATQVLAARRLDIDQDFDNEPSQEDLLRMFSHLNGSNTANIVSTPTTEDPNMMEWLYESMMARLVELDLQSIQNRQTFLPFSEVHYA
ncbi:hypothetical protein FBU30_006895 [Linnemannia zychae]|nr:hypothetical protein FBU30_006895 [Linnemannia zychae]